MIEYVPWGLKFARRIHQSYGTRGTVRLVRLDVERRRAIRKGVIA